MKVVYAYFAALICASIFSFVLAGCWVGFVNVEWTWPMKMSEEMLQAFLRVMPFMSALFGMMARSIESDQAEEEAAQEETEATSAVS